MNKQSDILILGIDLGGTKILTAVVDAGGNILTRDHCDTRAEEGPQAVVAEMRASADRCLEQLNISDVDIDAVGIGAPGPSDPETGVLFASPNLKGFRDFALVSTLEKKLHKKVFFINDANAAALAEFRYGAAKGFHHVIYITVSTGIGGAIIIDGKLYTGAIGTAAELGHMTIKDKGRRCNCGNTGCWETLASGTAMAREARRKIRDGNRSAVLDLASGDLDQVDAKIIYTAAQNGDVLAKDLIQQTGYYLGVGLANLLNIFNPQMIVIGGGVSHMGDLILTPAFKTAEKRAYDAAYSAVKFAKAKLGDDVGVLGAALFAYEKLREKGTVV